LSPQRSIRQVRVRPGWAGRRGGRSNTLSEEAHLGRRRSPTATRCLLDRLDQARKDGTGNSPEVQGVGLAIEHRDLADARAEAKRCLSSLPRRWAHVQTVGRVAESLVADGSVPAVVAVAAWLHDIGYGPAVKVTGLHPLDGARYLREHGWSDDVVRLVAHHTGAVVEAEERGLGAELRRFSEPDGTALDALCLADLTTSPDGERVTVNARLNEILSRYPDGDPVNRAITRSAQGLRAAAARAAARLESPDEWCRAAIVEGVLDS